MNRQFFEQFNSLFGSPSNLKNTKKTDGNKRPKSIQRQSSNEKSTTPNSTTPNILSPSINDSPNMQRCRTPASSQPNHTNNNNNLTPTRPLLKKQNSFSAKSDASNGSGIISFNNNPSVSNPNGGIPLNGIIVVNDINATTANNNNNKSTPNALNNMNRTIPLNTLNLTPLQNVVNTTSVTNPFSPHQQNTQHIQNILNSVPMSIVSNGSHHSSAVYQYPYITTSIPNAGGLTNITTTPNATNLLSASAAQQVPASIVVPINNNINNTTTNPLTTMLTTNNNSFVNTNINTLKSPLPSLSAVNSGSIGGGVYTPTTTIKSVTSNPMESSTPNGPPRLMTSYSNTSNVSNAQNTGKIHE